MQNIVIDKCYLQGVSTKRISELSLEYQLLMPISLLYELVKQTQKERAKLFKKFNNNSRYLLLPTFSELFEKELNDNRNITIPSDYIKERDYSLHYKLCDENFQLTEKQENSIKQQQEDREKILEFFLKIIDELITNKKTTTKKEMITNTVFNKMKIQKDYRNLRILYDKNDVDTTLFDERWFTYKWIQVLNLFSINIAYNYNSINTIRDSKKTKEKMIHDILDIEYLVFALSENNFATKEKKLINYFNQLSKNGICLSE